MIRKWLERGEVGEGEHGIIEYDSAFRQIVSEVFFGNYDVASMPSGNVAPVPFDISHSPDEIAEVLNRGAKMEEDSQEKPVKTEAVIVRDGVYRYLKSQPSF